MNRANSAISIRRALFLMTILGISLSLPYANHVSAARAAVTAGAPAAFSKSQPADAATNQSTTPTLSWEVSSGADAYQYCYDTTNDNICATWIDAGTAISAPLTGLTKGTVYYWQVRAITTIDTTYANDGVWWSFTTQPKTATPQSTGANDGWLLESSETSGLGGTLNSTATTLLVGDNSEDKQYRSVLSFSTGSLPDAAIITSARIKVCSAGVVGTNPFTTHGGLVVDIRKPYFGSAVSLQTADFKSASSLGQAGTFGTTPSAGCYTATLSPPAYLYLNLTGTTQFRLRFLNDDNDDLSSDYIKFYSGDYPTSSLRPVLMLRYYVP